MMKRTLKNETCNFINLFAGAFAISENLYIVTFLPDDGNICSLFIAETDTKVFITPQEAASEKLITGQELLTEANAKFVFNKEALLTLVGENTENLSNLMVLMEKHPSIKAEKILLLVTKLSKGKRLSAIFEQLIAMSTPKVTKLVEYAEEMPALLHETFINMTQV